MPSARYRQYAEALQWLGTNTIEMRQFVRTNVGIIQDATVRNGVLFLVPTVPPPPPGSGPNLLPEVPVAVNQWVVRWGDQLQIWDDVVFQRMFELDT